MAIHIRPFQEADRPVVRQLTIAAFEGVSIDHNIDLRLGLVAGRDWRCRKSRDIDRDIDEPGHQVAVAEDDRSGAVVGYVTMQCDRRDADRLDSQPGRGDRSTRAGAGPAVDRARPGAFPRGRHDDRQDRDARAERRSAGTSTRRSVLSKLPGRFTTRWLSWIDQPMTQDPTLSEAEQRAEPIRLEMRHISKSFGGVRALRDVSFRAGSGEVVALCGENGAGKSTLMKILAGAITEYEGEIMLDGRPVRFSGPRQAEDAGIRIIYQELNLVPQLSVADNIFLGREKTWGGRLGWLDNRAMERETERLFDRLGAADCIRGPRSATCGSATSRWSRSPGRWRSTPRS